MLFVFGGSFNELYLILLLLEKKAELLNSVLFELHMLHQLHIACYDRKCDRQMRN